MTVSRWISLVGTAPVTEDSVQSWQSVTPWWPARRLAGRGRLRPARWWLLLCVREWGLFRVEEVRCEAAVRRELGWNLELTKQMGLLV
jgi:hypothetical protein